eukprot:TRINITY_DN9753_c2_g2_i3.p1 TRINITY_DN9753_c2_g2~~TRINITY_DN9753_c2_g2_i3.p1  ORF type:complete len:335 (+),score=46.79 TRINITY_DN9753_c2_g2_i3:182-1186(+)
MLFMDYRRHHTGLWSKAALINKNKQIDRNIPEDEVPSFLYAMPLGGNRVFLEETCLVGRPPMPFETLKRRLNRRLDTLGIHVKQIFDEEWSYIPVGGPLPVGNQDVVAFGASACLVHPSTGYSIARSLREAPQLAQKIVPVLRSNKSRQETAQAVWDIIWSREKRAQASFHVFGMELLNSLSLQEIEAFFSTFFNLPRMYWEGFLGSTLSSYQLLVFAFLTYVFAPAIVRFVLLKHMVSDPSMMYLLHVTSKYLLREIQGTVFPRIPPPPICHRWEILKILPLCIHLIVDFNLGGEGSWVTIMYFFCMYNTVSKMNICRKFRTINCNINNCQFY